MKALFDEARDALGIPNTIDTERFPDIVSVIRHSASRYGSRPAFTCLGQTLSFRDVDRLSDNFAAYLQQTGLQAGDRVAIQLPNVLQYPVVVFGVLKAGMVMVNTNPLYTEREMIHQFNDAGAKAVIVLANNAARLQSVLPETDIAHVVVTEIADLHTPLKRLFLNFVVKHVRKMVPSWSIPEALTLRQALRMGLSCELTPVSVKSDDLAILQYTGGTTGVAKGAMLSHRNMVSNMLQVYPQIKMSGITEGGDLFVAPLPLYHIYAFMLHCMAAFSWGGHSLLIPDPRDTAAFVNSLKKAPFSVFVGLNTLFVSLMSNDAFRALDFSRLKVSLSGGMALAPSVAKEWQTLTGSPVLEGYGLTETSPVVTLNPPGHQQEGSIGVPIPATYVKTVNASGEETPVGEAGELCVQGPQVMMGYWQRPEATTEVIRDGWLHTGDVALIQPDGFLRIVDRKKDMILVSGFNVYPNELEAIVMEHPDVLECAAVGMPDEQTGEAVKMFVVSRNPALDQSAIRAFCKERMTAYKVPKVVEFRQELPKSNVGKILRKELR
ncbi:MAG: AMP-binding protein [Pseudomonadales bacterium]|nr:AMP-binding protein [Pseudomonadales bacterium]